MPVGEWAIETALFAQARKDRLVSFGSAVPLDADASVVASMAAQLQYIEG